MNEIVKYMLESILALGLFYTFYILVLEKGNLFRFNRFYLLSTSLLAIVFPMINISLPVEIKSLNTIAGNFLFRLGEVVVGSGNMATGTGIQSITLIDLIIWIYISGIIITAVLFLIKLFSLFRFIRIHKVERSGKYKFLFSNSDVHSFSFLHYIFIGSTHGLTEEDQRRIQAHEMAHVDQHHTYDSIYFEILSILIWFNPFIWLYRKKIVDVHEYLADEAVVRRTGFEGYSRLILQQVIGISNLQPASYFKNSKTIKRINKMKTHNKKSNKLIIALFLPVVLLVFFVISCNDNNNQISQSGNGENATGKPANESAEVIKSDATIVNEVVYDKADEMPVPQGGLNEFYKYIQTNLKYPLEAKDEGIQGTTFISFIIDKNGKIAKAEVAKGFNDACDREALRVVNASLQPWTPAKLNGESVNVKMVLPIKFALGEK